MCGRGVAPSHKVASWRLGQVQKFTGWKFPLSAHTGLGRAWDMTCKTVVMDGPWPRRSMGGPWAVKASALTVGGQQGIPKD